MSILSKEIPKNIKILFSRSEGGDYYYCQECKARICYHSSASNDKRFINNHICYNKIGNITDYDDLRRLGNSVFKVSILKRNSKIFTYEYNFWSEKGQNIFGNSQDYTQMEATLWAAFQLNAQVKAELLNKNPCYLEVLNDE